MNVIHLLELKKDGSEQKLSTSALGDLKLTVKMFPPDNLFVYVLIVRNNSAAWR